MNEQSQSILNENITKTAKIQRLLQMGMTRRAVADRCNQRQLRIRAECL